MSNIALLKRIWGAVYDPEKEVSSVIHHYFQPTYTQCINGVEMSFEDYITHVVEQKKNVSITNDCVRKLL